MDQKKFAQRLTDARTQRGLTKAALARAVGITDISVGDFELRGKTPALDTAVKIAHVLGVTVDWLCGDDPRADARGLAGASSGAALGKYHPDHRPPAHLTQAAARFEAARLAAGATPADVAQKAGCDVAMVDRLERAEELPPVDVRARLAEAVGETADRLFERADEEPTSREQVGIVPAEDTMNPYLERIVRTLEAQTEIARTQAHANAEQVAANHAQADANHALAAALRSQSEAVRAVADHLAVSHPAGRGAATAAGNE